MTLQDIAIFKHFIAENDLRKPFCKVYRTSRDFAKLPTSIEDYFSNVDPMAVILSACRVCRPNDIHGYDFWQDLHQDWKAYYQKVLSNNFLNTDDGRLEKLQGYYMILKENWDNKDKPWRYEDTSIALQRLGLPPIEESVVEETPAEEPEEAETDNDPDIAFIDIDVTTRRVINALQKGILSSNIRSHSWRLTVNRTDSKDIKKKDVKFVRVGKTSNGDVIIQFCNYEKGIPILHNKDGYCNVNSRKFVANFNQLMDTKEDLAYFRMEKISEKIDSITYKITKQQ